MTSSDSNRNNPALVAYYQDLADVLGIFWQFHRERIQEENIEFALVKGREAGTVVPFNPRSTHNVLRDFSNSVRDTMRGSWQQFLGGLGGTS